MDHHPSAPDSPIQLQGRLLLADPSLREPPFRRSVILLAHHSLAEGALGLVLNQPTDHLVGDFLKDKNLAPLKNIRIHNGGPVSHDQLTFSVLWWSKTKGLRWALRISAEDAVAQLAKPGRLVRAFAGYSGWSEGQLENELRRNSWIPARPTPGLLRQPHDTTLWTGLLGTLSPFHHMLSKAPDDPFLN